MATLKQALAIAVPTVIAALSFGAPTSAAQAGWFSQRAYCVIFTPHPEENNREPDRLFKTIHARSHTIADARGLAISNGRLEAVRRGGCTKWKRRYAAK